MQKKFCSQVAHDPNFIIQFFQGVLYFGRHPFKKYVWYLLAFANKTKYHPCLNVCESKAYVTVLHWIFFQPTNVNVNKNESYLFLIANMTWKRITTNGRCKTSYQQSISKKQPLK